MENVAEYWWDDSTSTAIPPPPPVSDMVDKSNKIQDNPLRAALVHPELLWILFSRKLKGGRNIHYIKAQSTLSKHDLTYLLRLLFLHKK